MRDRLCRLPLSGASPQARGAWKGDDRSRQFQNAGLGGRHFLGRTLRLSRSSGCVQFMASALTLTVSVCTMRPGRVLHQERPPAVSKRWAGLLFSKTVAG